MRIGIVYDCVYPYTLGGVEHRNVEIARRLASADAVTIYGFDYWRHDPSRKLSNCDYVSIGAARDLHVGNGKRKIADALAAACGTLRALLSSRDQVWDLANIATFPVLAAWLAAKFRRRGLVITWHEFFGPQWNNYFGPRLGPVARRIERIALRCSPFAIAVSPKTRDRLLAAGYPCERLRYIPNGIDTQAIEAAEPVRNGADLVYAGRLARHKRIDLAIQALQLLRKTRPGITLWIIGDGPERLPLEELADQLGVSDAVVFHGFLPNDADVFARMKSCRLALLPSAREGFGLAAVQAWACGLPVVVCDDPDNATADLVTSPWLGRVVPAKADRIAEAASELLNDPGDAVARRKHVREHYDVNRMVAAIRAVYEEALRSVA